MVLLVISYFGLKTNQIILKNLCLKLKFPNNSKLIDSITKLIKKFSTLRVYLKKSKNKINKNQINLKKKRKKLNKIYNKKKNIMNWNSKNKQENVQFLVKKYS